MKALGADIKDFWKNHWPENMYVEDCEESLLNEAGELNIEDAEKYSLSRFGYLLRNVGATADESSFETHFRRWIKKRDTVTIVVTVPIRMADECISLVEQAGWKAVKS